MPPLLQYLEEMQLVQARRRLHRFERDAVELKSVCMMPFETAGAAIWVVTWRAEPIDLSATE
jgi:hypothetical protein